MGGIDRPDDVRVQVRMGERETQDELHGRHAVEQVSKDYLPPPFPLHSVLLALGWRTLRRTAPNDDAGSRLGGRRDERLVLALDRRVGDLKDLEHAHGDVIREIGQGAGHADVPDRAGVLELEHGLQGAVLLQGLPRRRDVELEHVEIIGPHPAEALLHARQDIVAGEHMGAGLAARSGWGTHQATALARQIVFGAPIPDVAPDAFFAHTIVDRRVDVVDPRVEDGIENDFRLGVRDVTAARSPTELHGAVAQHGDLQSRPSELPLGKLSHLASRSPRGFGSRRTESSRHLDPDRLHVQYSSSCCRSDSRA
jgi:hypothetical protein